MSLQPMEMRIWRPKVIFAQPKLISITLKVIFIFEMRMNSCRQKLFSFRGWEWLPNVRIHFHSGNGNDFCRNEENHFRKTHFSELARSHFIFIPKWVWTHFAILIFSRKSLCEMRKLILAKSHFHSSEWKWVWPPTLDSPLHVSALPTPATSHSW